MGGSMTHGSLGGSHGLPDPIGNAIASADNGQLDPLSIFATNQPGGSNYQAIHGTPIPGSIPTLNGGMTGSFPTNSPVLYNPNSFGGYANLGGGPFNMMASQSAGPQYQPTFAPGKTAPSFAPKSGGNVSGIDPRMFNSGNNGGTVNLGSSSFVNIPQPYNPYVVTK